MFKLSRIPDKTLDFDNDNRETYKVAVLGSCKGAGASFVSERVLKDGLLEGHTPEGLRTLCEMGSPYFYTALGFEKRFIGRPFYEFSSHGKHELNMELGYNWYVKRPDDIVIDEKGILKNLYNAVGSLEIYDCSGLWEEKILFDILDESDLIYFVVDPMPTKLISSSKFIDEIISCYEKAELVVNKYEKGIHRGELSKFLGTSDYHVMPFMPIEKIYRAEYNCLML